MDKLRRADNLAARWWRSIVRMVVDRNEGVAGVEFALCAITLALMAVAALEFGMGFYRKMEVYDAAQAGAQYVIKKGYSSATLVATAVTSATNSTTSNASFSAITATPAPCSPCLPGSSPNYTPIQTCGCPTTSGITSATCGNACADGTLAATYVTVSAQGTYTPIFHYPGLSDSYTFTAQTIVRIK